MEIAGHTPRSSPARQQLTVALPVMSLAVAVSFVPATTCAVPQAGTPAAGQDGREQPSKGAVRLEVPQNRQRLNEGRVGMAAPNAANIGHDPAYEVTVVAWDGEDRVMALADKLPPSGSGETPAYIEFRLANRERQGPAHVPGPGPRVPAPEPPVGDPLRDYFAETHRLQPE